MKFTEVFDLEMVPSTKRAAPTGTPDREAQVRAKQLYTELVPKALNTEMTMSDGVIYNQPTSKVEISPPTMSPL